MIKVINYSLCLLLFSFALPLSAKQEQFCLQVNHFHSEQELGYWELNQPYFALSFIHSVSVSPVVDYYRLKREKDTVRIVQTSEQFENHGAGLPSNISEGTDWELRDGYFWLSMKRQIEKLVVRTDNVYKNRLHLGRDVDSTKDEQFQVIDLNQWPDDALLIQPTKCR